MQQQRGLAQTKLSASQVAKLLPQLAPAEALAVRLWNQAGGLDWQGLGTLIEVYDLHDPEALISNLLTIRNAKETK